MNVSLTRMLTTFLMNLFNVLKFDKLIQTRFFVRTIEVTERLLSQIKKVGKKVALLNLSCFEL